MIYTVTLNPAVDRELTVPSIEFDTVLRAIEQRVDVGGKGLNVSRAVHALGGESVALGFVGGNAGKVLADKLEQQGIRTDFIWIADETRTNVSVVTAQRGRHLKVNETGPYITPDEQAALAEKLLGIIRPDDWCVLSGNLPPNVPDGIYADLITQLQQAGSRVVLDTSGEALRLGCRAAPFLVTPNVLEANELTQQSDPRVAAQMVRQLGPANAIVTLGSDGALLAENEGIQNSAPPPIDERNAIGAGDALVGGVLFALEQGMTLSESLRWGVASGTVAAGLDGTEFGDRTTVERMLTQLISGESDPENATA